MLDRFVAKVVAPYLERYVQNIDRKHVKVSVLQGNVVLHDLHLRRDALRELRLPVCVLHGTIRKLTVYIPWTRMQSESIQITVEGVELVVVPKRAAGYSAEDDAREEHEAKMERVAVFEAMWAAHAHGSGGADDNDNDDEAEVTEALVGQPSAAAAEGGDGGSGKEDAGFMERLKASLIHNVQVAVTDVEVRYEDTVTNPAAPVAVTCRFDELTARTTDHEWEPAFASARDKVFFKMAALKGLSLHMHVLGSDSVVTDDMLAGPRTALVALPDDPAAPLLSTPLSLALRLQNRPISTDPTSPKWHATAETSAVALRMTRQQWDATFAVLAFFERHEELEAFRQFRPPPGSTPATAPRRWWAYAIDSVLYTVRKQRGVGRFDWAHFKRTRALEAEYLELHKRRLPQALSYSVPLSDDERARLDAVERQLTYESVAKARVLAARRVEVEAASPLLSQVKAKKERRQQTEAAKSGWRSWMTWAATTQPDDDDAEEEEDDTAILNLVEADEWTTQERSVLNAMFALEAGDDKPDAEAAEPSSPPQSPRRRGGGSVAAAVEAQEQRPNVVEVGIPEATVTLVDYSGGRFAVVGLKGVGSKVRLTGDKVAADATVLSFEVLGDVSPLGSEEGEFKRLLGCESTQSVNVAVSYEVTDLEATGRRAKASVEMRPIVAEPHVPWLRRCVDFWGVDIGLTPKKKAPAKGKAAPAPDKPTLQDHAVALAMWWEANPPIEWQVMVLGVTVTIPDEQGNALVVVLPVVTAHNDTESDVAQRQLLCGPNAAPVAEVTPAQLRWHRETSVSVSSLHLEVLSRHGAERHPVLKPTDVAVSLKKLLVPEKRDEPLTAVSVDLSSELQLGCSLRSLARATSVLSLLLDFANNASGREAASGDDDVATADELFKVSVAGPFTAYRCPGALPEVPEHDPVVDSLLYLAPGRYFRRNVKVRYGTLTLHHLERPATAMCTLPLNPGEYTLDVVPDPRAGDATVVLLVHQGGAHHDFRAERRPAAVATMVRHGVPLFSSIPQLRAVVTAKCGMLLDAAATEAVAATATTAGVMAGPEGLSPRTAAEREVKALWDAFEVMEYCANTIPARCVTFRVASEATARRLCRTIDAAAKEPLPPVPMLDVTFDRAQQPVVNFALRAPAASAMILDDATGTTQAQLSLSHGVAVDVLVALFEVSLDIKAGAALLAAGHHRQTVLSVPPKKDPRRRGSIAQLPPAVVTITFLNGKGSPPTLRVELANEATAAVSTATAIAAEALFDLGGVLRLREFESQPFDAMAWGTAVAVTDRPDAAPKFQLDFDVTAPLCCTMYHADDIAGEEDFPTAELGASAFARLKVRSLAVRFRLTAAWNCTDVTGTGPEILIDPTGAHPVPFLATDQWAAEPAKLELGFKAHSCPVGMSTHQFATACGTSGFVYTKFLRLRLDGGTTTYRQVHLSALLEYFGAGTLARISNMSRRPAVTPTAPPASWPPPEYPPRPQYEQALLCQDIELTDTTAYLAAAAGGAGELVGKVRRMQVTSDISHDGDEADPRTGMHVRFDGMVLSSTRPAAPSPGATSPTGPVEAGDSPDARPLGLEGRTSTEGGSDAAVGEMDFTVSMWRNAAPLFESCPQFALDVVFDRLGLEMTPPQLADFLAWFHGCFFEPFRPVYPAAPQPENPYIEAMHRMRHHRDVEAAESGAPVPAAPPRVNNQYLITGAKVDIHVLDDYRSDNPASQRGQNGEPPLGAPGSVWLAFEELKVMLLWRSDESFDSVYAWTQLAAYDTSVLPRAPSVLFDDAECGTIESMAFDIDDVTTQLSGTYARPLNASGWKAQREAKFLQLNGFSIGFGWRNDDTVAGGKVVQGDYVAACVELVVAPHALFHLRDCLCGLEVRNAFAPLVKWPHYELGVPPPPADPAPHTTRQNVQLQLIHVVFPQPAAMVARTKRAQAATQQRRTRRRAATRGAAPPRASNPRAGSPQPRVPEAKGFAKILATLSVGGLEFKQEVEPNGARASSDLAIDTIHAHLPFDPDDPVERAERAAMTRASEEVAVAKALRPEAKAVAQGTTPLLVPRHDGGAILTLSKREVGGEHTGFHGTVRSFWVIVPLARRIQQLQEYATSDAISGLPAVMFFREERNARAAEAEAATRSGGESVRTPMTPVTPTRPAPATPSPTPEAKAGARKAGPTSLFEITWEHPCVVVTEHASMSRGAVVDCGVVVVRVSTEERQAVGGVGTAGPGSPTPGDPTSTFLTTTEDTLHARAMADTVQGAMAGVAAATVRRVREEETSFAVDVSQLRVVSLHDLQHQLVHPLDLRFDFATSPTFRRGSLTVGIFTVDLAQEYYESVLRSVTRHFVTTDDEALVEEEKRRIRSRTGRAPSASKDRAQSDGNDSRPNLQRWLDGEDAASPNVRSRVSSDFAPLSSFTDNPMTSPDDDSSPTAPAEAAAPQPQGTAADPMIFFEVELSAFALRVHGDNIGVELSLDSAEVEYRIDKRIKKITGSLRDLSLDVDGERNLMKLAAGCVQGEHKAAFGVASSATVGNPPPATAASAGLAKSTSLSSDGELISVTATTDLAVKTTNIAGHLGTLSVFLQDRALTRAITFLYEPYQRIVLASYVSAEPVIELKDHHQCHERLVLSHRRRMHAMSGRFNFIELDMHGNDLHLIPAPPGQPPVITVDTGVSFVVRNARVHLYGKDAEATAFCGNGGCFILSATAHVVGAEEEGGSDTDPDVPGQEDANADAKLVAAASAKHRMEQRQTTAQGALSLGPDGSAAADDDDDDDDEPDVTEAPAVTCYDLTLRLDFTLPDSVGARALNVAAEVQVEVTDAPGACPPRQDVAFHMRGLEAVCLYFAHTNDAAPDFGGTLRLGDDERPSGLMHDTTTSLGAQGTFGAMESVSVFSNTGTVRRGGRKTLDYSSLIAPWAMSVRYDRVMGDNPTTAIYAAAERGVDVRLRVGDTKLVIEALHQAKSAIAGLGVSVGGPQIRAGAQGKVDTSLLEAHQQRVMQEQEDAAAHARQHEEMGLARDGDKTKTTFGLRLKQIGLNLIDDTGTGLDQPLIYFAFHDIRAPVLEWSARHTAAHLTLSMQAEYFNFEKGGWRPLLRQVGVDLVGKKIVAASLQDVMRRAGHTRFGVTMRPLQLHLTPMAMRVATQASDLASALAAKAKNPFARQQQEAARLNTAARNEMQRAEEGGDVIGNAAAVQAAEAEAGTAKARFTQYTVTQFLGFPVVVSFAEDRLGRFPAPITLEESGASCGFNFPRIDGKELALSQHRVVVSHATNKQQFTSVFVGDVGLSLSSLSAGNPLDPMTFVVDVSLRDGQKVIVFRSNITFANELGFPVHIHHVGDVSPGRTVSVPAASMTMRARFTPQPPGLKCDAAVPGPLFDSLPLFGGLEYLCTCPVLLSPQAVRDAAMRGVHRADQHLPSPLRSLGADDDWDGPQVSPRAKPAAPPLPGYPDAAPAMPASGPSGRMALEAAYANEYHATPARPRASTLTNSVGVSHPIGTSDAVQQYRDAHQDPRLAPLRKAGKLPVIPAAQEAVYLTMSYAEPKTLRMQGTGLTADDTAITFRAPFAIENRTGAAVAVGLYYKRPGAVGTGGRGPRIFMKDDGASFAHVTTLCVEEGSKLPVTEVDPVKDVYMDLILGQPTGESLSRTDTGPVLIRSHNKYTRATHLVLRDSHKSPLCIRLEYGFRCIILSTPYWVVNHSLHYMRIRQPRTLQLPIEAAGQGQEGLAPCSAEPFLLCTEGMWGNVVGVAKGMNTQRKETNVSISFGRSGADGSVDWSSWSDPVRVDVVGDHIVSCGGTGNIDEVVTAGLNVAFVGGPYKDTLVLTFTPRWIFLNRCGRALFVRQPGIDRLTHLGAASSCTIDTGVARGANVVNLKYAAGDRSGRSELSDELLIDTISESSLNLRYGNDDDIDCTEFDVIRASVYRKASVLFVAIDEVHCPPHAIENRTPFHVNAKQINTPRELMVHPRTTKGFVWDNEKAAHRLRVTVVSTPEDLQHCFLNLDPHTIVKYRAKLRQTIVLPRSRQRIYVRVRASKGQFAISLTMDDTIDRRLVQPFTQRSIALQIERLHVLLANGDEDIALVTVDGIQAAYSQGNAAAGQSVHHQALRAATTANGKTPRRAPAAPQGTGSDEQSASSMRRNSGGATPPTAPLDRPSEGQGRYEREEEADDDDGEDMLDLRLVVGMVQIDDERPRPVKDHVLHGLPGHRNTLHVVRRMDRVSPVLHVRLLDVAIAPLWVHLEDGFLYELLAFTDRVQALIAEVRLQRRERQCLSTFDTAQWAQEVERAPDEGTLGRRVTLVERLLVKHLLVSVSLYRGQDPQRDPLRDRLGLSSAFIRSVRDARFDWRQVNEIALCDRLWLLAEYFRGVYVRRLQTQVLNVVNVAGMDTMRTLVNDLLDGYMAPKLLAPDALASLARQRPLTQYPPPDNDKDELAALAELDWDPSMPDPESYNFLGAGGGTIRANRAGLAAGSSMFTSQGPNDRAAVDGDRERRLQRSRKKGKLTKMDLDIGELVRHTTWDEFVAALPPTELRHHGLAAIRHHLRASTMVGDSGRQNSGAGRIECRRCFEVERMRRERRGEAMSPLPHPSSGQLSWAEFCHHVTWAEFAAVATDFELAEHCHLLRAAVVGVPGNMMRLHEHIVWCVDQDTE